MHDDLDIQFFLDTCMESRELLNTWECDFIESLNETFTDDGRVTDKQLDKLITIYQNL